MSSLYASDLYKNNLENLNKLDKSKESNIKISFAYFKICDYKKALDYITKIKQYNHGSFTLLISLLFYSHRYKDIITYYNLLKYNNMFQNKNNFRYFLRSLLILDKNINYQVILNKYIKNNIQYNLFLEVISTDFTMFPIDKNIYFLQMELAKYIVDKDTLYTINNIELIVDKFKKQLNIPIVQFLYMNNFILEHPYFDKRLIALKEINKIKTDDNLVHFIENIDKTFFYSFDSMIDNNEFIGEIKQFYSLSKKLPYNNLSGNIAIICKKTSLNESQSAVER